MAIVARIAAVACPSTTPFVYGIRCADDLRLVVSASDPRASIDAFLQDEADFALVPAAAVPALGPAHVVTGYCVGALPAARERLLRAADPLTEAWKDYAAADPRASLPFAFAVWVARPGADPDDAEALHRALTFGLEHAWEAVAEASPANAAEAYAALDCFDYIYDREKERALHKFWNEGRKIDPRVNPG